MSDLVTITREQYDEYKALRRFNRVVTDKYGAFNIEMYKLKLIVGGLYYFNDGAEGLVDFLGEMILNIDKISSDLGDFVKNSIDMLPPPDKISSNLKLDESSLVDYKVYPNEKED